MRIPPDSSNSSLARPVLRLVVSLLIVIVLGAPALLLAAESSRSVAIIRLRGPLEPQVLTTLTDQVAGGVRTALEGTSHTVMTPENLGILSSRSDDELAAIDAAGQSDVELGRSLGAAWVVSGHVARIGETWAAVLKVHATVDGHFLASLTLPAEQVSELVSRLGESAATLVRDALELAAPEEEVGSLSRSFPLQSPAEGEVQLGALRAGEWRAMEVRLRCSNDESPSDSAARAALVGRLTVLEQLFGGGKTPLQVLYKSDDAVLVRARSTGRVAVMISDGTIKLGQRQAEHGGGYWLRHGSVVRLLDSSAARAPGLELSMTIGRPVLVDGDLLSFEVHSSQAAVLLALSLSEGEMTWLVPGPGGAAVAVDPSEDVRFPTPEMRRAGLNFQVGLPEGTRQADEVVLVLGVASAQAEAIRTLVGFRTLSGLLRALSELPPSSWGLTAAGYHIDAR